MKKFLVLTVGAITSVAAIIFLYFQWWKSSMRDRMPQEGKQIFAQIDSSKCSSAHCEACTSEECLKYPELCSTRDYIWTVKDKAFKLSYCASIK